MMMHSNYVDIRHHIYAYLSRSSCRAAEATQRHANPWNIDMIFMDWMCYSGVEGIGGYCEFAKEHIE